MPLLLLLLLTARPDLAAYVVAPLEQLGTTVRSVTNRMGPPRNTSFELVANMHVEKMRDVRVELEYPAARVTVYVPLCCETSLLEKVRVTDRALAAELGLSWPEDADAVRARFGEPDEVTPARWTYHVENKIGVDTISFDLVRGRVVAAEWRWFLD